MALTDERIALEQIPSDVLGICEALRAKGKRAWVVGGSVRDVLMGRAASDWDVCTDATPQEMTRIFPRAIPTGIDHGTMTVLVRGTPYEVTTLRGDGTYSDGRRPDSVAFTTDLVEDLARRDFTVNAIAADPLTGDVFDPFGGRADLAAGVLRAVGDPMARFAEDGLRVLRAARFVATLDLRLDERTELAIEPNLPTYRKVSAERVRDEWIKTMKARTPSKAFEVMRRTGILGVTCPELLEGVGVDQNRHHAFDVWRHNLACLDACAGDPVLRIAALFHDVGKPRTKAYSEKTADYTFYDHDRVGAEMVEPICTRLRFSNDERARIAALVRFHLIHYSTEWSDAAVRRWLRRVGRDRLEDLYTLNEADVRAKGTDATADLATLGLLKAHVGRVMEAGAALSVRDLAVNGKDLLALGMRPGRRMGEVLEALLELVLTDPALNTREVLTEKARALVEET